MALLIGAKTRVLMAMRKEAKSRGLSLGTYMDTVSPQDVIALIRRTDPTVNPADIVPGLPDIPPVDVTRWGLPPESALSTDLSRSVPVIGAAVAAARAGDWRPAAHLLDRSYGDWGMRAAAVHALGEAAADDPRWLQAWQGVVGEDRHTAVVNAQGLLWLAWKLRGNRPEATTEQHEAFHETQARSEAAAYHAIDLAPEDPTPWCTLVTLARGRGFDLDTFSRAWRELQARDPLHRSGHEFAVMYLSPEDGPGSYDPLFAFAERAAAASPSLAFLVLKAAYDYEDQNENIWKDRRIHRAIDALLGWLHTPAGGGGVYANSDRSWAAYALVSAGRGAEAVPLFAQLGTDASSRPWEDFGPDAIAVFDSFRRRACAAAGAV
jgi:hypothetical protein